MSNFRGTKENLNTRFTTSQLRSLAGHWRVPLGTGSQQLQRKADILDAVYQKLVEKNRTKVGQGKELWFNFAPVKGDKHRVTIQTAWVAKEGPPRVPELGERGGRRQRPPGAAASNEGEGGRGGPARKAKRKRGDAKANPRKKDRRRAKSPSAARARAEIQPGRFENQLEQASYDQARRQGESAADARAAVIAQRSYARGAQVRVGEEQDAHENPVSRRRGHHASPSVANAHASRPPNARVRTVSRGLPGVSEGISNSEPNEAYDSRHGVRRAHHSRPPRIVHPGSAGDLASIQRQLNEREEKSAEAMPDLEMDPLDARFAALQQGVQRPTVAVRQDGSSSKRKQLYDK